MASGSGKGLRLISFDAGGVRGLSQLRIMGNLIHRLEFEANPDDSDQEILPCGCVEMMGGSDTGGLIALMFGKLRMSVKDTIKEFHKICSEVYMGDLSPSMRTQKLRDCIEDLLRRRGLPVDLKLGKDNRVAEQGCPCFVIATPKANMDTRVKLRTYRTRSEQSLDITLVDAILATCATQPTFLPITVGPELNRQELVGGVMGTANPCRELVLEAQDRFKRTAHISTIISVGSGRLGTLSGPTQDNGWIDVLRNMVASCERTAQEIETQIGHFEIYSRFSVEQGLQRLYGAKADDLQWLNTQTAAYVQDVEVSRRLDECVERLISRQEGITLEQLGLSSAPRADLQAIQSMTQSIQLVTQDLLVSAQDEKLLEILWPKDIKGGPPVEECLDGTREHILQNIIDWIADLEAANILWLKAHPGAGKTAIALTLVQRLRELARLGSSFFFQRAKAADLTPHALWCKAAFDLAYKDPAIRTALVTKLKADRDVANTNILTNLFHHLIEGPLLAAESTSTEKSLVIIVDALDECGGLDGPHSRDRKELLRTIQKWSTLPRGAKLIVTSRGEDDIERILQSISHVVEISTGSNIRDQSWTDIKQFLTLRFKEVATPYGSLRPDWPGRDVIEQLADRAGGLFIWARTVVQFIGRGAAEQQLSRILKQASGMGDIAALYSQVLGISFPEETDDIIEAFHSTFGAVIFAKTPLSLTSLSDLLSIEQSRVEHICTKLKSVIHIGDTIQVMHQSFVDFLIDARACPSAFHIRAEDEEQRLAMACLRTMRDNLRFNICNLESSYLLNSEVHDMGSRIGQNIPSHVLYSCQYWIEHLVASKYGPEVFQYVRYFTENQFLFWLEVLSVTSQINTAPSMLSSLKSWIKKHNQDESMVADMVAFTTTFASVIAQSVPHIYLSALPFAPQHSAISNHYKDQYPGLIRVERGGLAEWPGFECVMHGHSDEVSSVAISQDGTRIVSGSRDKTVRVWDAATGQPLGAPFEGHIRMVNSVAFSPDGTRIVSGSDDGTVRVWDAATGQPLLAPMRCYSSIRLVPLSPVRARNNKVKKVDADTDQPVGASFEDHDLWVRSVAFSPDGARIAAGAGSNTVLVWDAATGRRLGASLTGHTGWVRSVAFSPDGTRIVSGSSDGTVRVWDAANGQPLGQPLSAPFKDHVPEITSVTFSPDGTRIVSGSSDKMVQVWDAVMGQSLGLPFKGHTGWVTSVSFSPDGTRIVSGSHDKTVRVWDATTGQPVGAPFKGHTFWVTSVAFSPDGTRIVSGGSHDRTVRMWDAARGQPLREPSESHSGGIRSVAFSPDGTRIVSGSHDKTVRVWDSATGQAVGAPFTGHSGCVRSVAFSPDGTRIVSGSHDNTVRVWDAATGRPLGEPLKGHVDWVTSVTFTPDGAGIVSGSDDGIVRMWDAATGRPFGAPFEGHTKSITSITFSLDGTRIFSGSRDKTLRVWHAATGQPLGVLFEGHTHWVMSVAFLPDGTHIVSGFDDKTLQVWDAVTGQPLGPPSEGDIGTITSTAFSPDGTRIVSGSDGQLVLLWDAITGQKLGRSFPGHADQVTSVAFSPDGARIVTGSKDWTVRIWDTVIDEDIFAFKYKNIIEDWVGRMVNSNFERLFWVLPSLQAGLWLPGSNAILGNFITKVDTERFEYGESWTNCRGIPTPDNP